MFSFFKKKKEPVAEVRMPAREAARPKPPPGAPPPAAPVPVPSADARPAPRPQTPPARPAAPVSAPAAPAAAAPAASTPVPAGEQTLDFTLSEFDRGFTRSSVMAINVSDHLDHLPADVEQVAVIFANGQAEAARSLLDAFLQAYPGSEGERFWQMYFALLELAGDQSAHEALGKRYEAACGGRPPAWREAPARHAANEVAVRETRLELSGDVLNQKFEQLVSLLQGGSQVLIDCARVRRIDFFSAGQLASQLVRYRQPAQEVIVHAPNQLVAELMAVVGLNNLAEIYVPKE